MSNRQQRCGIVNNRAGEGSGYTGVGETGLGGAKEGTPGLNQCREGGGKLRDDSFLQMDEIQGWTVG